MTALPNDLRVPSRVRRPLARTDAWASSCVLVAMAWGGILLILAPDAAAMIRIWWTSSTFEHCLFIPPIIAWLVWQRAPELRRLTPRGWAPGLLLVAGGALGWLVGQAAGVALARHLGLVMLLQGAVVATLGPSVARGLLFPLAYALFLVPAGEGLVAPLQTLTARICTLLLHLWHIPARLDGVFITTSAGWFEVAEACSGAKFLIAMIALGALAAHVCFRSWRRRALFLAAAITLPILANGLRAFATILVAHYTDAQVAGGFDHVVYGWFFFGIVIALLLAVSWRWFDRAPTDPAFDPRRIEPVRRVPDLRGQAGMAIAAVAIAAGAVGWSIVATAQARLSAESLPVPIVAGWVPTIAAHGPAWVPRFPGADRRLAAHYQDAAGNSVDLVIVAYGEQAEGREIVGYGIGAIDPASAWAWGADGVPVAGGRAMRIVGPGDVGRDVLIFYRIGRVTTGSEARVKIETLRARLLGRSTRAVAVLLSAQVPSGGSARPVLDRFRTAMGPVGALADRALR